VAEGDNLARIATVLGEVLVGRHVVAVGGRHGGPLGRVVGSAVVSVEARGKHLLIGFADRVTLHTHLGLHGSWHRYRPGERWRRAPSRAAVVIEAQGSGGGAVCVCFDPARVELLETRALALHPALARLGPDASAADFDPTAALARLRAPERAAMAIGDALLDQSALAGVGNVYRSEVCFIERVDPLQPVGEIEDEALHRLLDRSTQLLRANLAGGPRRTTPPQVAGNLYVYGRTGRPCRRCGSGIVSGVSPGGRRAYWCPRCQGAEAASLG